MARVVSLNLQHCLKLYQRLYLNPLDGKAEMLRRRLLWALPRLSPTEQDRYYAELVKWKTEREKVHPDPGIEWPA